jgi:hypothetical protein
VKVNHEDMSLAEVRFSMRTEQSLKLGSLSRNGFRYCTVQYMCNDVDYAMIIQYTMTSLLTTSDLRWVDQKIR